MPALSQQAPESPYRDIAEVPDHLRAFIVSTEPETEPEESNARYELGVTYRLTSAGRQGRAIHRQEAELEAEAEQRAWAEDVLSEQQLRSDIADALEDQNSQHVGRQVAEAQTQARWLDMASDAAELRGGE